MRAILLFIVCGLASFWLAFFQFEVGSLGHTVIFLSYPILFVAVAVWLLSLWRLWREGVLRPSLFPRRCSAWIAIAAVTGLLLLLEPFEFKIVYDELLLSSSAQLTHYTRIVGMPQWANDYHGSYMFMSTVLDKRPLLFPFLLSLVHDFTGYRYLNVFILNAFLSLGLVTLIYMIGKLLSNHKAGILGVLLAGSLPLLSIMATSGHFEVLNLVMISVTFLLAYLYLKRPSEVSLVPLVFSMILLSQVRYENSVYLLPFGILILLGWRQSGRIILPWQVIICPLFLIVSSLHYRVILNQEYGFFQEGPNGRLDTFSTSYVGENLVSAWNFLFSTGQSQPNAYLLSVLGFSAVGVCFAYLWKRRSVCLGKDPKVTAVAIFFLALVLLNGLLAFFNYGLFDAYITNRLSLPLHLLFIILIPYCAARYGSRFILTSVGVGLVSVFLTIMLTPTPVFKAVAIQYGVAVIAYIAIALVVWKQRIPALTGTSIITGIYILTISMPVAHAGRYSQKYISNDIVNAELDFINARKSEEKILWISSAPYPAFLLEVNTTSPLLIKQQPANLKRHLMEGNYDSVYISRRMKRAGMNIYECLEARDILDPEVFELETIDDIRLNLDKRLLISRLVDVHLPAAPPARTDGQ